MYLQEHACPGPGCEALADLSVPAAVQARPAPILYYAALDWCHTRVHYNPSALCSGTAAQRLPPVTAHKPCSFCWGTMLFAGMQAGGTDVRWLRYIYISSWQIRCRSLSFCGPAFKPEDMGRPLRELQAGQSRVQARGRCMQCTSWL